MKQLPNLLKQETSSAETLVNVLVQMYYDSRPKHQELRSQVAERFLPYVGCQSIAVPLETDGRAFSLGLGVIQDFNKLRPDTQAKNIAAWMPVIAKILDGFNRLDEKAVRRIYFVNVCLA